MNKKNPIIYQDSEKTIFKIFSKHGIFECIIDTEDVEKVKDYKWHIMSENGRLKCVAACPKWISKTIYIHQLITKNSFSDHIDNDVLNNRKNNLRECTYSQNQKNMSPHKDARITYKGVDEPRPERYRARITCDLKCITIGFYNTPEKAAQAYNEKAIELHKDFAKPNII